MVEGDSSVDGGRVESLACADPGARTSIGASEIFKCDQYIMLKIDTFKLLS